MLRASVIILLFLSTAVFSQSTEKYKGDYARFYKAEDLYEKMKYSAAEEEFNHFMAGQRDHNDPIYVKAMYYSALSALHLYHADAERRLLKFLREYPESIHRQNVYLELGRYYYRGKKFIDAIEWLELIDVYDLTAEEKEEFYFKLGYSHFRRNNLKKARDAFYEIISSEGQYQAPALYYYSHIAYTEKSYQTALEGFTKLKDDPSFKDVVPYYIAQIYYLQGKYEMLLEYAPNVVDSTNPRNEAGMAHLVGDAFYKIGKYDEAVPFLEEYNKKSATTRDEDYQLGYAYYKSGDYENAIPMFGKVAQVRDELGQIALYHIGECYLKREEFLYARNAFEAASVLSFDAAVEEDALYNYAVLSYKLDYNPFDEAVEAMNLFLERYPNSPRKQDMYQYLVNVYTTMGNYKSAMESIDRIEEKDFKMKNAYQIMAYNHGVELFENGEMDQAIDAFKLVKRYPIDPKLNAMSLYWIAEASYKKADYPAAIAQYRAFLDEPGGYGVIEHNDAYYNMAYAYFKQKDYANAIQYFRTFTQDETETHKEKITDAYLRIGDSYFVRKPDDNPKPDDDNAILFYQKAIATGGGQIDYAKFQIGLSYGFKRQYTNKASIMLDIVNNHARSPLAVPALYEAGESYRLMSNADDPSHKDKAIKYYRQLIQDHPRHLKVVDAIFQIGMLHLFAQEYNLAEKQFLQVVNEYPGSERFSESLDRLRDVYTALNRTEEYSDLLDRIGQGIGEDEKDELMYDGAFRAYEDSSFTDAAASFKKYLNRFARPRHEIDALFFMADSYRELGQMELSANAFKQLLERPTNFYTEEAAGIASKVEYDAENYQKAADYYLILENSASFPENKLKAEIGLMRCYTFLEDLGVAADYAKKVLADPLALDNVKVEAHYVIGKAALEANNYDKAMSEFKTVTEETSSVLGAEAQYSIALIYHLQEKFKKSEDEVRVLMKERAGYNFWVAKALILQAKNSIGLDDYIQAEYTINSVLNGYTIMDDGILDEANVVMEVITAYKNQEKDLGPDVDNTIEIGDGND
ncbi:MAG: tetratricopeptide repeat protein [Crocinitomix sp.]|nr:tetratricopeptide repeat protein [Crocinitomix sp.]